MFNKIKLKISNYILRRAFLKKKHYCKLTSLSHTKKIALLFDASDVSAIEKIKSLIKYFLKLNIDVDALGFVNSKKKGIEHISTLHINYFNTNDLDLVSIPNSRKINTFLTCKYDLVINLSFANSFPTKYLTLMSKSNYRIGVDTLDSVLNYDLIFKLKFKSLDYLIENLIYYLELIDKNNAK